MSVPGLELVPREQFGHELREVIRSEMPLPELALAAARLALRASYLSTEQKQIAMGMIRAWTDYVQQNEATSEDPYAIRRHVTRFAKDIYDGSGEQLALERADISQLSANGVTYESMISELVSPDILRDESVAVYGGTARLALKMLAGVDIQSELPVHDIDAIISSDTDITGKANNYGVDLAGAKIVEGAVQENLPSILANTDCTMNQVAIYKGELLYAPTALADVRQGIIRLNVKRDALFGTEGAAMPSGETYINKKGFYRGLSFLLRGKGQRLAVSNENLEREKHDIGRYWLIMLLVKLLPVKNQQARYDAVGHWHDVATRIGVTEARNPKEFFEELTQLYPETRATNSTASGTNTDSQTRWIIEKLGDRLVDRTCGEKVLDLPETYTPGYIELSKELQSYDMEELLETVRTSIHSVHSG